MATKLFVNLAVKDLKKTNYFFSKLGFLFNPQFSNEEATCMIINDDAYIMLLHESFFKNFTKNQISDAHKQTEVLTCISRESKQEVNEMVDKAVSLGGKEVRDPLDHGFMFARSFHDLDGHIWEIMWMDANAAAQHQ